MSMYKADSVVFIVLAVYFITVLFIILMKKPIKTMDFIIEELFTMK